MIDPKLFDDLRARIDEALRGSPAQDIEKNLRALLAAWFDRLDLVLREDFEVQRKLLERAQAKLPSWKRESPSWRLASRGKRQARLERSFPTEKGEP